MGKAKKNKKQTQIKRKQMLDEVFKRGKKQREIAKKFDDKIAQKQGNPNKRDKFKEMKLMKKKETHVSRDQVAALDKKLNDIRTNRKPGQIL